MTALAHRLESLPVTDSMQSEPVGRSTAYHRAVHSAEQRIGLWSGSVTMLAGLEVRRDGYELGRLLMRYAGEAWKEPPVHSTPATPSTAIVDSSALHSKMTARAEYKDRIAELRRLASDDNITVLDESENAFIEFASERQGLRKGSLVLADDGTFRAVWWAGDDSLALHFRANRQVVYVHETTDQSKKRKWNRGTVTAGAFAQLCDQDTSLGAILYGK